MIVTQEEGETIFVCALSLFSPRWGNTEGWHRPSGWYHQVHRLPLSCAQADDEQVVNLTDCISINHVRPTAVVFSQVVNHMAGRTGAIPPT